MENLSNPKLKEHTISAFLPHVFIPKESLSEKVLSDPGIGVKAVSQRDATPDFKKRKQTPNNTYMSPQRRNSRPKSAW